MLEKLVKDEDYFYFILHPIRFKILTELQPIGSELSISDLENKLKVSKQLIIFHVLLLEQYSFITSRLSISEIPTNKTKGKAIKTIKITPKFNKYMEKLKKTLLNW